MKTIRNLFFVAFAAMTVAGCQEELANPNDEMQGTGEVVTFTGSVDYAETKTAIHYEEGVTEFATLFTTDDLISVNGVKSETVTPSSDQRSISFGVADVTGPYYAVTGTHDRGFDASTNSYSVLMPGTGAPQKYRTTGEEGQYASFWTSADILAACSESEELKFKHMSVFYAITINPETSSVKDNIKTIYVRQGDGSDIAGTWTLSFGENGLPSLEPKSLTALIAYDCGEEGLSQGATMIVGLPAYNYAEGLIFTIKDVNGKFASFNVPAEKTQHATDGGLIIPFKPNFKPQSRSIKSVEDWEAFAACMNAGSKDWDVYTWIGDGTIKLEADISADDLTPITKEFKYVFDGGGNTITQRNATASLFTKVSGEIKNLTLAGNLNLKANGAPFVTELAAGGKITDCTNEMDVTFNIAKTGAYVSAFAAVLPTYSGDVKVTNEISGCTNRGDISGYVDVSANTFPVAIGAIVGDARSVGSENCGMTIYKCKNEAPITVKPISGESADTGMNLCGIGGIIGRIRTSKSEVKLEDCDNSGSVTLSAERIISETGLKAHPICVGGIVGLAANVTSNMLTNGGFGVSFKDCENTGNVYNCGVNASPVNEAKNKVYTGGFAGALMGSSSDNMTLTGCSNTGDVLTYDLYGETSALPGYCAVAGGFVGFGGYLEMEGCTVNCEIGNGKRPMVAWSGVVGFAINPIKLNKCNVYAKGSFQRLVAYKMNRAMVAVVPTYYITLRKNSDGEYELNSKGNYIEDTKSMEMSPSVAGSTVTDCYIGGHLVTSGTTLYETDTKEEISGLSTNLFNSEKSAENNIFAGTGYDNNSNCDLTIDKDKITNWDGTTLPAN